jgi:hypothetical protein
MPHDPCGGAVSVLDGLDDAVIGDSPDAKWRPRFEGCETMIAVHPGGLTVDANYLMSCHMALYATQRDRATLLDYLHPATDAEHGQPARFSQIKQSIFDGVAFRSITTQHCEIIPAGQH